MYLLGKLLWFLLTPSNLLTLLVLCGAAMALPGGGSRKGIVLVATAAIGLAACGFGPVGFWLARPLETRFPRLDPMPDQIAGFIVLGGGVRLKATLETKRLSLTDAGDRMLALGDLARRYPQAKIVMSGGTGDVFDEEGAIGEAELVRRNAAMLGIDPARIIVEDRSRSTYENALYTRRLIGSADGGRWLLVTSAWHMPRAVGVFRKVGLPVIPYPVDFRAPSPDFGWRGFVDMALGLRLTDLMAKEWVGLLAYRLMGRTDALLPAAE